MILSDKKNKIMPFAAIWMDLGIVILSDVGETEKTKYMILFICIVLKNSTNELIYKQKLRHRCQKQTYGYQRGKGRRDNVGNRDSHIHSAIYKIDNYKDLLYTTRNSSLYSLKAYIGKEF